MDTSQMRQAVCALIVDADYVLTVGRFSKTGVVNDLNLPGGKVDPGETLLEAVAREVLEETGCIVEVEAVPVYEAVCPGEVDYYSTTFRCRIVGGRLESSDEGTVQWAKARELLAPHCCFRDYNRIVLVRAGLISDAA